MSEEPHRQGQDPCEEEGGQGGPQGNDEVGLIPHPEHRALQQDVGDCPAPQGGGESDNHHAEDIEALAPGLQHPGRGHQGNRRQTEPVDHGICLPSPVPRPEA